MVYDYACPACAGPLDDFVEKEEKVLDEEGSEACQICHTIINRIYFSIKSVQLTDALTAQIIANTDRCGSSHCGKLWDNEDKEYIADFTNTTLLERAFEVLGDLSSIDPYEKLLRHMAESDMVDSIEIPDFTCGHCGSELNDWNDEIEAVFIHRLVPEIPELPDEIKELTPLTVGNAHTIEFFRTDCSPYLIHLTKENVLLAQIHPQTDEPEHEKFSAPEILWMILQTKTLKVNQGIGMQLPAVCFTEKPLSAVKDMLMGQESKSRNTKSIRWAPYGIMFTKEYLNSFAVEPVISLKPENFASFPVTFKHRIIPYSDKANFLHEREWRTGKEIVFDPKECIVILPNYEQVEVFRTALVQSGIVVKGFLSLNEIFACI